MWKGLDAFLESIISIQNDENVEKSQHRRNPNFWLQCISAHLLTLCELLSGNQVLPGQQWSSSANNRQQATNDIETPQKKKKRVPHLHISPIFPWVIIVLVNTWWDIRRPHEALKRKADKLMWSRTEEIETIKQDMWNHVATETIVN